MVGIVIKGGGKRMSGEAREEVEEQGKIVGGKGEGRGE